MRRCILVMTFVSACGHVGPKDQPVHFEPPTKLEGTVWAPSQSPQESVNVTRPCFADPDLVRFGVDGSDLTLARTFYSSPSGVPHQRAREHARGSWKNGRLILQGTHTPYQRLPEKLPDEPTTYMLQLEAESGNLVGTRNEQPIRLAPANLRERKQPCPSPPPQTAPRY